jgi:hypothetical protein
MFKQPDQVGPSSGLKVPVKATSSLALELPQDSPVKIERLSARKLFTVRRELQLVLIATVAIGIAALSSHLIARWVKIDTTGMHAWTIGTSNGKPPAFLTGSSLSSYGISWNEIAKVTDTQIKVWGLAGGSPVEFEQFQRKLPEARTAFVVVSVYDLDESLISDFRAEIVPIGQMVKTLWETRADWSYSERVLSQYPITWLRTLFPTLGRSRALMGKLRQTVASSIKPTAHLSDTEGGPTIKFDERVTDDPYRRQRMSDWSQSKIVGKLVAMRVDFQGPHSFNGPKRMAFERMLRYGTERGRTVVIVLPVSPAYSNEFIRPETSRQFEQSLTELQRGAPQSEWLRLDQVSVLASDNNFCDLVHMNLFGKKLATEAFLRWLR